MNIFREFLLNLAGGSPKEKYIELRKDNAVLNGTLRRIRTSIYFGAQCSMCLRTYEIHIDITKPLKDKKQPVKGAHCLRCHKHPMLWWYSMFEITSIEETSSQRINK